MNNIKALPQVVTTDQQTGSTGETLSRRHTSRQLPRKSVRR